MAISIIAKPNTDAPDGEYPYGKIRDKVDGLQEGTNVDAQAYGDFHQFFAKIMDEGGISFNDVPDNAYDGFQYYDALLAVIDSRLDVLPWQGIAAGPGYQNSWVDGGGALSSPSLGKYKKESSKFLVLRGVIQGGASGTTVFNLPVGYRPAKDFQGVVAAGVTYAGNITVETNGDVKLYFGGGTTFISLEGVRVPLDA